MLFTPTKRGEEEMKKMLRVMAAGTLFAAGTAQADTVTSVNVVGYYSVTIPSNRIALVTPVLESFQAGTLEDLIGTQLPVGSFAYIWDRTSNGYISASRTARGGWGITNLILRGDAVWLKPAAGTPDVTVTFMGEVPGNYNVAATTTVANISGIDAVGYGYPVDILWTNTALSQAVPDGSFLHVWTGTGYNSYSKTARGGWGTANSLQIKAGQAFWIQTSVPTDWEETVPYNL